LSFLIQTLMLFGTPPKKGDLNGLILISDLNRSQYQCIELHTYHIQVIYTAYKHIAGLQILHLYHQSKVFKWSPIQRWIY